MTLLRKLGVGALAIALASTVPARAAAQAPLFESTPKIHVLDAPERPEFYLGPRIGQEAPGDDWMNNAELRAKTEEITAGISDPLDQAIAIFEWIGKNKEFGLVTAAQRAATLKLTRGDAAAQAYIDGELDPGRDTTALRRTLEQEVVRQERLLRERSRRDGIDLLAGAAETTNMPFTGWIAGSTQWTDRFTITDYFRSPTAVCQYVDELGIAMCRIKGTGARYAGTFNNLHAVAKVFDPIAKEGKGEWVTINANAGWDRVYVYNSSRRATEPDSFLTAIQHRPYELNKNTSWSGTHSEIERIRFEFTPDPENAKRTGITYGQFFITIPKQAVIYADSQNKASLEPGEGKRPVMIRYGITSSGDETCLQRHRIWYSAPVGWDAWMKLLGWEPGESLRARANETLPISTEHPVAGYLRVSLPEQCAWVLNYAFTEREKENPDMNGQSPLNPVSYPFGTPRQENFASAELQPGTILDPESLVALPGADPENFAILKQMISGQPPPGDLETVMADPSILIRASGTPAGDTTKQSSWPHLNILLDEVKIGELWLGSTPQNYEFKVYPTPGVPHTLSVQFDNDKSIKGANGKALQDRNAYVDRVEANGNAYLPARAIYDLGKRDGLNLRKGQRAMNWNGTQEFRIPAHAFPKIEAYKVNE